jgi:glycosyltransferase involved in cell wall biosynthesis
VTLRFSVIIPAYNAGDALEATVRSALDQRYDSFEVIVSDDGSADDTLARARAFAETDAKLQVVTGPNGGCSLARNRGIEAASGEYCVLLDSDDRLDPDYLETMSAFIERCPGYDVYSCNGLRLMAEGRTEPFFGGPDYAQETSWGLADLIPIDRIFIMATFKRDLHARVDGFRNDLRYAEDYDFWLRAMALGATHRYTPQLLGTYVESASGKSKHRIPHAEAQIRIFTDLAAMPELSASERALCERKLADLRARIERVKLETRLQEGDFADARATYTRLSAAYISKPMYAAGWVAMMLSPRLYARLFASRSAKRSA